MIIGVHTLIYSKDPGKDRAFLKEVLGFDSVDAGRGWLIFAAPPAEIAVHPADGEESHEMYLMCDDLHKTIEELQSKNVKCSEIHNERWGLVTHIQLPGGGRLGMYEPKHPLAIKQQ